MQVVLPTRGVRSGFHHRMAAHARSRALRGRPRVLVAHEACSVRIGSGLLVMDAEALGMAGRFYVAGVAHRRKHSCNGVGVASLAVGHPEFGWKALGCIVARYAVHHFRQSQVRQAGASGNAVVTSSAVQIEFLLLRKMRDVSKFDVHIFAGNRGLRDQAPALGETEILDFLRRMTARAALRIQCGRQLRRHAGLRMAGGALSVARKLSEYALRIEFMTERAIRAEARARILPALFIDVVGVRKPEQNSPRSSVPGKRQQVGLVARGRAMACGAEGRPRFGIVIVEIVRVTRSALIVTRPLQFHRAIFHRGMA
jgi:hypothetical protein